MNTIKINVQNKKIVAHRGASRLEKENTLAAFIAAGNRSYYGIECDIHRTADGRYVVIHDETTKRVAGDSVDVENSSFHLVRSVVLDDIDGTKRKDLFPPTLEEYLKRRISQALRKIRKNRRHRIKRRFRKTMD